MNPFDSYMLNKVRWLKDVRVCRRSGGFSSHSSRFFLRPALPQSRSQINSYLREWDDNNIPRCGGIVRFDSDLGVGAVVCSLLSQKAGRKCVRPFSLALYDIMPGTSSGKSDADEMV